jgi:hypothetical protein
MASNKRSWTVLVYMVADHKEEGATLLDSFAEEELRAIANAADLTDMHVAVQVDFTKLPGTFRGTMVPSECACDNGSVCSDSELEDARVFEKWSEGDKSITLCHGKETNAADPNVLARFLKWGRTVCPAQRYAILFWGHSFGPMGLFLDGGTVSLPRVAKTIDGAFLGAADVVLFKDCLMNTLETAYEMQGVAKYAIGSQALIPIKGVWPYTDLFAILQTASSDNALFVARALAARLGTHYDDRLNRAGFAEVPMSMLDLSQVQTMTEPLKEFVKELRTLDASTAVTVKEIFEEARAGRGVSDHQHPGDPALLDFTTLCRNLVELETPAQKSAEALNHRLRRLVPWAHSQRNTFNGISIYYVSLDRKVLQLPSPRSVVEVAVLNNPRRYRNLALNEQTEWSEVALEQF